MKIIDAHAHLGMDQVFDVDFREEDLLASQESNDISMTLVQPPTVHDIATARQCHDAVADLVRRYSGRFHGVSCPNPHLPGTEFEDEARRCVEELGFVALKLHPLGHATNPVSRHGRRMFKTAAKLGVPVIVHTGAGIPWAAPSLLRPIAEEYIDLKIVLAHAGANILSGEATQLAQACPNVYLEPSWTGGHHVLDWVRGLGPRRVMFGSDHAENAATELTKYRTIGLTEDELSWVLGQSAATVFGLQVR